MSSWYHSRSMRKRDPHGIALRRAMRAAVVVPLSLAILTQIPAISGASLFGVFAVMALLIFPDFGGTLRERTLAYLATVAAGIPIMVIGAIAFPCAKTTQGRAYLRMVEDEQRHSIS